MWLRSKTDFVVGGNIGGSSVGWLDWQLVTIFGERILPMKGSRLCVKRWILVGVFLSLHSYNNLCIFNDKHPCSKLINPLHTKIGLFLGNICNEIRISYKPARSTDTPQLLRVTPAYKHSLHGDALCWYSSQSTSTVRVLNDENPKPPSYQLIIIFFFFLHFITS